MAQNGQDANQEGNIFTGVYFAVIPSESLTEQATAKIIEELELHDATHCPLSNPDKLENVTHLISTTSDFPAYHDAVDAFIHVVKPSWVNQSILKNKAANPRQHSPDPRLFFSEVVVCCADDIPENDKDAIVAGVQAMGGQYSARMSNLVTHVVALSMEPPQVKVIAAKNLRSRPVIPHWFNDCLKLGKILNTGPYTLPNPALFREHEDLPSPYKPSRAIAGAISLTPDRSPPTSPSKARKTLSAFGTQTVMLSDDLKLSKDLKLTLTRLIEKGGGKVTSDVKKASAVVCQYRDGKDFQTALGMGIDVGNLNWLYFLISNDTWTSPTRRLLHYPLPKNGITGFQNHQIAVSNYSGEARIYLESLVKASGATFTKTLTDKNTHLIVAHTKSEKCQAALEWNVNMINHLWLEESYAKCKEQAVTVPRYTTFPSKTNLVEVVGRTEIDREEMWKQFFPNSKKASVGKPTPNKSNVTTALTPSAKQNVKANGAETPAFDGKENETPGSRGAKARALNKLHSMAPDIALYQKERKRAGGVVYGGRRVSDPDRIILDENGRKRSHEESFSGEDGVDEDSEEAVIVQPSKKKTKSATNGSPQKALASSDEPILKVIVTGFQRWVDHPKKENEDKAIFKKLNIRLLNDSPATAQFDILAAPRIMKTRKFLAGLARAPKVISTTWLEEMLESNARLDIADYELQDDDGNEELGDALSKAVSNRDLGGLFKNQIIFCTDGVKGGHDSYKEIISANGGVCTLYRGRETNVSALKRKLSMDDELDSQGEPKSAEEQPLYLISNEQDKKLWPKFKEMAESEGHIPRIVVPDWLTAVTGSQDASQWDDKWLLA